MAGTHDVTQLLLDWQNGDQAALDRLAPIVHAELHRIAQRYMRNERPGHTLETSGLINEAYLRLVGQTISWQSRTQFFGIAARLMRQILIDHARTHLRKKRGGDAVQVSLSAAAEIEGRASELIALDEALHALAEVDLQKTQIIELRFFGGLTIAETAAAMGISDATVEREWRVARARLKQLMTEK
jgi:RNA polymerase sigma factor (TIGR02999 family)